MQQAHHSGLQANSQADLHDSHSSDSEGQRSDSYFPLILILTYLTGGILLSEISAESFSILRMMNHFMSGFFIIFSFFKFLNLRGFVDAYQTYDIVAKKFPVYGWIYPFIELGLGISYFLNRWPLPTHWVTLLVMLISSIGVAQSLLKKQAISCACLGTIFKLPMTQVTLFEDLIMAGMALTSLIQLHT